MPNIKSAIKRVKITEAKTTKNTIRKSALKTAVKKCSEVIEKKDASAATVLSATAKILDKAASKNVLHKNTACEKEIKACKGVECS